MKKLTAILLLCILLFNWVGYRFLINYVDESLQRQLTATIDAGEFNEEELIEVKVPLSLPYQANWDKFERFDGDIQINGMHYKYVKRKVYNDSLILMCIPNHEKTLIQEAKSNFFQLANDYNNDSGSKSNKKSTNAFKSLVSDCVFQPSNFGCTLLLFNHSFENNSLDNSFDSPVLLAPERPPSA